MNQHKRSFSKTALKINLDNLTHKKFYKKLSQGNYKFLSQKLDDSKNQNPSKNTSKNSA